MGQLEPRLGSETISLRRQVYNWIFLMGYLVLFVAALTVPLGNKGLFVFKLAPVQGTLYCILLILHFCLILLVTSQRHTDPEFSVLLYGNFGLRRFWAVDICSALLGALKAPLI
jgi:hypothetical protein